MLALTGAPDGTGSVPGRPGGRHRARRGRLVRHRDRGVLAGVAGPPPEPEARPVQGLDVSALFGPKEVRRADRFVQLAAPATDEAVGCAGASNRFGATRTGRGRSSAPASAASTLFASSIRC